MKKLIAIFSVIAIFLLIIGSAYSLNWNKQSEVDPFYFSNPKKYVNETNVTTSFFEDIFSGLITTSTQNWFATRNFRPRSTNAYDIGAPTIKYRNIYLSGNLSDGAVNITI